MSRRNENGQKFASVKSIHIHEKWNAATNDFAGDIAVIKLNEPVSFTSYIKPVCIATSGSSQVNGTVIGWGVHDDSNAPSDVPRKLDIPIVGDRECLQQNQGLLKIFSGDFV